MHYSHGMVTVHGWQFMTDSSRSTAKRGAPGDGRYQGMKAT
jgi:hypothetical protein